MSGLSKEEFSAVMREHGGKDEMQVVWKFYCGLENFHYEESLFEEILKLHDDTLFHCACAFESQEPNACDCLIQLQKDNDICISDTILVPSHFLSIGFVVSNSSTPVSVVLLKCNMSGVNMGYFASSSILCENLQHLDLSSNVLTDDDITTLAEGLKETFLLTLSISKNEVGDEGIIELANSLEESTSLESLDLSSNKISGRGMKHLCESLKDLTELKILNVGRNKIQDEGVHCLSESLKSLKKLKSLHLERNEISGNGIASLAEGLKYCTELQSLYLGANECSLARLVPFCR